METSFLCVTCVKACLLSFGLRTSVPLKETQCLLPILRLPVPDLCWKTRKRHGNPAKVIKTLGGNGEGEAGKGTCPSISISDSSRGRGGVGVGSALFISTVKRGRKEGRCAFPALLYWLFGVNLLCVQSIFGGAGQSSLLTQCPRAWEPAGVPSRQHPAGHSWSSPADTPSAALPTRGLHAPQQQGFKGVSVPIFQTLSMVLHLTVFRSWTWRHLLRFSHRHAHVPCG